MLLPFFEWCEQLWFGQFIVSSNWLFPVIESVHLLGLAVLGGTILLVDMRLLGLGLKNHPVPELAREVRPWLLGALVVMVMTGVPLFLSEPIKCYYSQAFWNKMTALAIGLLFTFTIRARVTEAESVRNTASTQVVVGAMSLAIWFTVAASGRWIGFS
jgi:hypothetical protein